MKKIFYLFLLIISAYSFNSCSKANGQDIDVVNKTTASDRYIIVYGITISELHTAVRKLLPEYKPTGGPFLFHMNGKGTEYIGQALYK